MQEEEPILTLTKEYTKCINGDSNKNRIIALFGMLAFDFIHKTLFDISSRKKRINEIYEEISSIKKYV